MPIATTATIHLLVALDNKFDWDLSHFDVEQAFVQSDLEYETYKYESSSRLRIDVEQDCSSEYVIVGTETSSQVVLQTFGV